MKAQLSKARLRPVIRVFISSTFTDMKHERDALQQRVVPTLTKLCLENDFHFQAIDLRWGVSTEASLDHRAMRVCFDELRRAQEISPQPNFLILLGDRYGWRPLPEEISVAEFWMLERAAARLPAAGGKPPLAILREWYVQDTNADPPLVLLQSRRQRLADGKDYTRPDEWQTVQAVLWQIINQAIPGEAFRRRFEGSIGVRGEPPSVIRFQASATEQEIWRGAFRIADAADHVLAFVRRIENIHEFSDASQIAKFVDVDHSGHLDTTLSDEQARLASTLCGSLDAINVIEPKAAVRLVHGLDMRGAPLVDLTTDHLPALCGDVERCLAAIMQRQFEEYWSGTPRLSAPRRLRELQIEQEEHTRFALERGAIDSFVGRAAELTEIRNYVRNDSRDPLVVYGASGVGKTALLARAVQEMSAEIAAVVRFIGVTPRASDVRALLRSICEELGVGPDLPAETDALAAALLARLASATRARPIVLILDALDQLSDADDGRGLGWIPRPLPAHVKMVVSCVSDRLEGDPAGRPFEILMRYGLPPENVVSLGLLAEDDARGLIFERWLPQASRKLTPRQCAAVERRLASPACRQPIYLKLLYEEIRHWHSYDEADALGEGVPALLGQLVDRLRLSANHGPLLISRVLGYLAASRRGLAENEILELLFADPEYRAALDEFGRQTGQDMPPEATRIPIAIWSRLRVDLAPYLAERAAPSAVVLVFYHRQVSEWIGDNREKLFDAAWHPHERLARYFRLRADPGEQGTWAGGDARALEELPHHLAHADDRAPWRDTMCDPQFAGAACAAGLVYEWLRDVDAGLGRWSSPGVRMMRHAVASSLRTIAWHPALALSAICNRLFGEDGEDEVLRGAVARGRARLDASGPWLAAVSPFRATEGVLFGHPTEADRPAAIDLANGFKTFVIAQDAIAAASSRGDLEIRDIHRGALLSGRKLPVTALRAVAVEPTRLQAAWIEGTGDVRAEGASGALAGRRDEDILAFPAPDSVIAVGRDGTLLSWNPQTGAVAELLAGLPFPLIALRVTPDGRCLVFVAGQRADAQVVGLLTRVGASWRADRLDCGGPVVTHASVQPDGARVALACADRSLAVVDVASGAVLRRCAYEQRAVEQLRGRIEACAFGGQRAGWAVVAATHPGQVFRWDWQADKVDLYDDFKGLAESYSEVMLEFPVHGDDAFLAMGERGGFLTRRSTPSPEQHRTAVTGCALTASGKLASISHEERTLRWWEFDSLRPLRSFAIDAPAALAAAGDDDLVFVATHTGRLFRFASDRELGEQDRFAGPVVNTLAEDAVTALAAEVDGTITRVDFARERPEMLHAPVGALRQQALLSCARAGTAYIAVRQEIVGDQPMVVSLGSGSGHEIEIYRSALHASVGASRGCALLATADTSLTIWRIDGRHLHEVYTVASEGRAASIDFVADDAFLIVARERDRWLELRRCGPGLPLAAVLELPAEPTCLSAREDKIAVGFRSGALLCVRLRGGARQP